MTDNDDRHDPSRPDGRRNNVPPAHTQFKKGQSGNPKGRPKGSSSLFVAMQKALRKKVRIKQGDETRTVSRQEAIIMRAVEQALKGDKDSLRFLEFVSKQEAMDERQKREKGTDQKARDGGVLLMPAAPKDDQEYEEWYGKLRVPEE